LGQEGQILGKKGQILGTGLIFCYIDRILIREIKYWVKVGYLVRFTEFFTREVENWVRKVSYWVEAVYRIRYIVAEILKCWCLMKLFLEHQTVVEQLILP